jgi:histidine triad (HIT) family protein
MEDCPFCDLFAGRREGRIIRASDAVVCFFPLKADCFAHTLIAPRAHHGSLLDCPERTWGLMLDAIGQVTVHYRTVLGASGFNLLMADGAAAEQSVAHLHLHYLPRFAGDGFSAWPVLPGDASDLDALAERLRLPG